MDLPSNPTGPFDESGFIGSVIGGRYQVVKQLGRGGMGATFLASDVNLMGRLVAVKVLLTQFGHESWLKAKFQQEAEALSRIHHPSIINILDIGTTNAGYPYLVMEYADGVTLRSLITDGRIAFGIAASILRQLGNAINAAHDKGIVHRDLKPENIIVTNHGDEPLVKIIDFGIARVIDSNFNVTTAVVGTPYYMSPEQMSGDPITPASDVYSLGVTAYEMLTGGLPYRAETVIGLYQLQQRNEPTSPRHFRPDLPEAAESILLRALASDPEDRYARVRDFCYELADAIAKDSPDILLAGPDASPTSVSSFPRTDNRSTTVTFRRPADWPSDPTPTQPTIFGRPVNRPSFSRVRRLGRWILGLLQPPAPSPPAIPSRTARVVSKPRQSVEQDATSADAAMLHPTTDIKLSSHLTVHLSSNEPRADMSSTVLLRLPEVLGRNEDHVFEELILHKDFERLWRAVTYAGGGNYLLTGYGPFGGTSLMRCAIAKARDELQKGGKESSTLLVFYFQIKDETRESFKIEASSFCFGHLPASGKDTQNSDLAELRKRAAVKRENSLIDVLPLEKPLGVTFFKAPSSEEILTEDSSRLGVGKDRREGVKDSSIISRLTPKAFNKLRSSSTKPKGVYDFSHFIADLNDFFKKHQSGEALHHIVLRLAESEFLPSRVVIIIDKIRHLETLKSLSASSLFNNKRIMVLALARKEEFDSWEDARHALDRLDFSKWYVPCVWDINEWGQRLFSDEITDREALKTFLRYLEYKGRGSIGNLLQVLRHPEMMHYGEKNFVDITALAQRVDVVSIAWLQGLLEASWKFIFEGVGLTSQEVTDRARLGVYELLDWMTRRTSFSTQEVIQSSRNAPITVSDDEEINERTAVRLLRALVENGYLKRRGGRYHIAWDKKDSREFSDLSSQGTGRQTSRVRKPKKQNLNADSETTYRAGADTEPATPASPEVENITSASTKQSTDKAAPAETAEQSLNDETAADPSTTTVHQKDSPRKTERVVTTVVETDREVIKTETYITPKERPADRKIKILLVFATPRGSDPLRIAAEDRTVRECIRRSKHRDALNEVIIHAARAQDFQRKLLDEDFEIVHFSGHGTPSGKLIFEDEQGQPKLISQEAIASLLSKFSSVKCVVLNACYSVNKGQMTAIGDLCTIAMEGPISDEVAQIFTRGFYDALGAGRDYEFSYQMGCEAIKMEGHLLEANRPKFLKKSH